MHGVTKPITFEAEYSGQSLMMGVQRAGLTAKTKINRKDFDLGWGSVVETGQVAVSEIVTALTSSKSHRSLEKKSLPKAEQVTLSGQCIRVAQAQALSAGSTSLNLSRPQTGLIAGGKAICFK